MVTRSAPPPHQLEARAPRTALPRPDSGEASTPLMKQYLELKEAHPREVLFFRMGDFYEMFFEDAEIVARTLGIAQTTRASGSDGAYAMAGFPYHALDRYLPRMIAAGFRVAICEQVEDPALVKGKRVVRREVIEVVTPGTLTDERLLEERRANYLLGVHVERRRRRVGLAWFEASSGRFLVSEVGLDELDGELERIGPAEVVVADKVLTAAERSADLPDAEAPPERELVARLSRAAPVSSVGDWAYRPAAALEALCEAFGVQTLKGLGLDDEASYVPAAHAVVRYVSEMKPGYLDRLDRFGRGIELYQPEEHLALDPATARCLEITRPLRESNAGRQATLLGAIDRTQTAMGCRLLREWLLAPLRGVEAIERRQEAVASLLAAPAAHEALGEALRQVYDLERLAARAASGRVGPRDLAALRDSLARLPLVQSAARAAAGQEEGAQASGDGFFPAEPPLLCAIAERLAPLAPLQARLQAALCERPAAAIREGHVLQRGVSAELDRLRSVTEDAGVALREFQEREAEATGIASLKVGYNKVFGYYLEVTQAHKAKVPARYLRKQTLKHAERFLTPELKELESEILTARERAEALEGALFEELKEEVAAAAAEVLASAAAAAELDVLGALATLARQGDYVRPKLRKDTRIRIVQGRHPVLDVGEARARFVPNDLELGQEAGRLHLITGPNMAGKSTYIRQAALLVLLAQVGAFVPAREAEIGVCDRIFARVGAGDELAQGLSTFMVEMTETANILRHATKRSLVILDEVGRGTSTYDGVSLAWAIAEHLHDAIEARTLFATHYHELTGMAALRAGVRNRNVAVEERGHEITFLHQIVPGSADRSYGIHVARLAGVPPAVLKRAAVILGQLEQGSFDPGAVAPAPREPERQLALFSSVSEDPVRARLREVKVEQTTPLDALLLLQELKGLLES